MSTVAALSPDPSRRFLAFRLLTTLILQGTEDEAIQLMLLKDLIEDCPYEPLRVAAIGILREVLVAKFAKEDDKSIFVSPVLLDELGKTLLRFEPASLLDGDELGAEDFCEGGQAKATMEKLTFLYFLLAKDKHDQVSTAHLSA